MGLVARFATTLLGGVALGVLGAQVAEAQTTINQNGRNVTLLERLVIGAGAPKVAIDTPQAVTVVDQKDIDDRQAATTGELFDAIPGVRMVGSDRLLGEAFNIRGIGTTENSSDGSRIVVTVDGAPKFNEQYRMGSFFSDAELYKKIEVLRGPASSTLYGSGAIGGVISFTTKDASDFIREGHTGAVRVKGSYGTNGATGLVSAVVAQRINDTFEILATGNFRRSGDMTLAKGTPLAGSAFDAWSGLIKGTAHFGNNDEEVVRLSYQRWQSQRDDQAYAQTGTQTAFGTTDRSVSDDTAVLSYENPAADNPWLDVKLALSYSNTRNAQSGASLAGATNPNDTSSFAILNDTTYAYTTFQLKGENTVEYKGDDFANFFTLGFQASRQDRAADKIGAPLQQHPEGIENKFGLFAQDEYVWDERLTLIAGARADFHNMVPDPAVGATAINGVALSPKLAALYKFNNNFGLFGSVAHTERFPTLDELFSRRDASAGPPAVTARTTSLGLQPEYSNNYELGFTTSAYDLAGFSNQLSIKTTAFYNDLTNMIATGTVANGPYYVNVNKAQIYGLEVEGAFDADVFFARLAYTFTRGQNTATWAPLTTVPQSKLVATLGARQLDWNLEYGARITTAAAGEYVAPIIQQGQVVADGTAEAWTSVDLFASWKPTDGPLAGTEWQFGIDNLFDANYRENLATDRSKGRTFKLTLAKQFDY